MSEVKRFVIKKYLLVPLANLLGGIELKSKMSRARSRFINMLIEKNKEIESARVEMVDKYVVKGEDGKPKLVDGRFDFGENAKKIEEEINALINEDTTFDVLPSNEKDFELISNLVLNTDQKFSNSTTPNYLQYEAVCEAFESIN